MEEKILNFLKEDPANFKRYPGGAMYNREQMELFGLSFKPSKSVMDRLESSSKVKVYYGKDHGKCYYLP